MGGEIGVESNPGVGARFWFTLLYREALQPKEDCVKPAYIATGTLNLHVLVAEDNPVNQLICQAMLNELGAAVIWRITVKRR
ncbi:MAG: hypothetical protein ACJAUG_003628 [Halioglobus sp.]|jgi:hypothetical protein